MSYKLKELDLQNSKKDRDQFIDLSFSLYADDKNFVPPLRLAQHDLLKGTHPFYKTSYTCAWICLDELKVVGRIMAVYNKSHNDFHQENVAFFGFFETINNQEVANILLDKANEFAKEKGATKLRGPMNPSTNYECGLLIDGFDDPPQIMMTYNPPFYKELIEAYKMTKVKDLLSYYLPAPFKMPPVINQIAQKLEASHNITYRKVSKKNWDKEINIIFDIYNDAWENNWGFVPMTKEEFLITAKEMKHIVDEELLLFAMVEDEAVGFILSIPDYNQIFKKIPNGKLLPFGIFKVLTGQKKISRFRTITMGIKKDYRKKGLDTLLYYQSSKNLSKKPQYKGCEMGWVLEDNLGMTRPLERMNASVVKKYRIFEKQIV